MELQKADIGVTEGRFWSYRGRFGLTNGVTDGRLWSYRRGVELPMELQTVDFGVPDGWIWSCQKKEMSIIWLVLIGEKSGACKANKINRA